MSGPRSPPARAHRAMLRHTIKCTALGCFGTSTTCLGHGLATHLCDPPSCNPSLFSTPSLETMASTALDDARVREMRRRAQAGLPRPEPAPHSPSLIRRFLVAKMQGLAGPKRRAGGIRPRRRRSSWTRERVYVGQGLRLGSHDGGGNLDQGWLGQHRLQLQASVSRCLSAPYILNPQGPQTLNPEPSTPTPTPGGRWTTGMRRGMTARRVLGAMTFRGKTQKK